ncbi:hypothetical protein [Corynebacterium tuscaniense]|nr:hypothetical protein [Corynebacterium tuscaniense]
MSLPLASEDNGRGHSYRLRYPALIGRSLRAEGITLLRQDWDAEVKPDS